MINRGQLQTKTCLTVIGVHEMLYLLHCGRANYYIVSDLNRKATRQLIHFHLGCMDNACVLITYSVGSVLTMTCKY